MNASSRQTHRPLNSIRLGSLVVIGLLVVFVGLGTPALSVDATLAAGSPPTFEDAPCPAGVVAAEGSALTCGFLTVLEDRSEPKGRTIKLFIARSEPLEGELPPDPMLQIGSVPAGRDLGWASRAAEIGAIAGRVNFVMELRGVGYSEPSLTCPEIERLASPLTGITLGTPEMETAFLQAVHACHDRLTASGIDLASYNLAEMAADAEDLRTALGIGEWNIITYGTTSSVSFEIMRRYPEHIRTVSFDSPMAPQVDRFTQAILGTDYAFGQVVEACNARHRCHEAFPHLRAAWRDALRGLDAHPSSILDEDLNIVVDDATAVRQLRNNLALGGHLSCFVVCDLQTFPLAIYDLKKHGWLNGGPAGTRVEWSSAPPFHVGYDIQWWPNPTIFDPGANLSHGLTYSYLCHDEVPFIDQAALADAAGNRPWYDEAYVNNPYPDICERWDVGRADTDPHDPLISDIPTLMLFGQFDPFSPVPLVRDAAAGLSNSSIVNVAAGRNVLDNDCTIGIRNAFVDDPSSQPDTSCVADLGRVQFLLPPPPTVTPGPGDAVITTVAGDGAFGSSGDGNLATQAQLNWPEDIVVDADGNLYTLDSDVGRVRKVDGSGRISTVVGAPTGVAPPPPGEASTVDVGGATALAIDAEGNLYVGGGGGTHRMIIRVDPSTGEVTTIAGTGERGFSGDGGPATEAELTWVRDIAVDPEGNVYFTDFYNQRVRMVDTSGIITTIAGTGKEGFSGDDGPATEARLDSPVGIALGPNATIFLVDRGNHRVRRIDRRGMITTVAGNGKSGYSGDRGPAMDASLGRPSRVAFDAKGILYVSSEACGCVRRINAHGIIFTIAGSGVLGYSGDGGPATRARLWPLGLTFGPDGSLYIGEALNSRVRRVVFP
jgi:pimeloyl-ACP methyl ester carboxylesterase/sugar lactone lactonase YvrE